MRVQDITTIVETAVPLRWQESYDNAGLIVGHPDAEVDSALLAVDITEEVLDEAEHYGSKLIIAHHPVIFNPIKRLTASTATQRIVERAICSHTAFYGCHTNLDSAPQVGINHHLARLFGLRNTVLLDPAKGSDPDVGIGVVGDCPSAVPVLEFLSVVKARLNLSVLRYSRLSSATVGRVALCSGSGGSLIDAARAAKADLYLSADFKYHNFVESAGDMVIADIGHFESEYCAIEILFDIIRKKMPTFALYKTNSPNPVNYL